MAGDPVWKENPEDGTLELTDPETGEVIARQKRNPINGNREKAAFKKRNERFHWVTDAQGRRCWVPTGTNPDVLPRLIYPFSQITCEHICDLISQGMTLEEVGKVEGMPPTRVIWTWRRKYPEFDREVKAAKKARAEVFHDKAIATAKQAKEARVQSDRLRVETYKWAAEMNDREVYGKQTKVTGDPNAPIAFIIQTGVPEPEKPPEKEVVQEKPALPKPEDA